MIGILPCAGTAERFHNLPKYLLPCPGGYLLERHIDQMKLADARAVMIGVRPVNNTWVEMGKTLNRETVNPYPARYYETMSQTVLSAIENMPTGFKDEQSVLFGMPDTFIQDETVYHKLASAIKRYDVAVAVFEARPGQHAQGGMVGFSHNQVTEVVDKPAETNLQYIWGALAWKPAFWDCLSPDMPHVGYGLPVAIERGLNVRAVVCEGGFWDCGTPERYFDMIKAVT